MSVQSFESLEMCFQAFKAQMRRNSDALFFFAHWYLVRNGFVCTVDGRVNLSPIPLYTILYLQALNYTENRDSSPRLELKRRALLGQLFSQFQRIRAQGSCCRRLACHKSTRNLSSQLITTPFSQVLNFFM